MQIGQNNLMLSCLVRFVKNPEGFAFYLVHFSKQVSLINTTELATWDK